MRSGFCLNSSKTLWKRCDVTELVFMLCRLLAFVALTGIGSILVGIALGRIEV